MINEENNEEEMIEEEMLNEENNEDVERFETKIKTKISIENN